MTAYMINVMHDCIQFGAGERLQGRGAGHRSLVLHSRLRLQGFTCVPRLPSCVTAIGELLGWPRSLGRPPLPLLLSLGLLLGGRGGVGELWQEEALTESTYPLAHQVADVADRRLCACARACGGGELVT